MDRSPSPHHLESLNQEDKAANMAAQGMEGIGQAPHPVSLLNLPDELLTAIFDQVYRSQRPFEEDEDAEFGLLVPLEQILVNKRIFRLARPIWFHHLTAPSGLLGDTFLSELSAHHHDHHIVQSLFTEHPYAFPSLHSSVLALLSNLTSLSLFFPVLADPSATTYTIPFAVTRALKSLPRLEHLKLTGKPQLAFEDASFCLDRDLPTLQHLDADETLLQAVLSYSATTLRALTVRGNQHPFSSLPWATLVSLRLLAEGKFRAGPHGQLVDTLRRLKGRPVRLRHLILGADCFGSPAAGHFDHKQLEEFLELLQHSALDRLEVDCGSYLKWSSSHVTLPSVKVLTVDGGLRLYEADNLPNLWAFTRVFPSLAILHLREVHWSPEAYTVLDMANLDSISLILSQPSLAALLIVLRKTSILELRISDVGVTVQMRWTRFTKEEDFAVEAWSMGGENNL